MMLLPATLPAVPIAHGGGFHIGDLIIAAPLLIVILIGAVLFLRSAHADRLHPPGVRATEEGASRPQQTGEEADQIDAPLGLGGADEIPARQPDD